MSTHADGCRDSTPTKAPLRLRAPPGELSNERNNTRDMQFRVTGNWEDTGQQQRTMGGGGANLNTRLQGILDSMIRSGSGDSNNNEDNNREEKVQELYLKSGMVVPNCVYRGHRNCRTICKEANFYGMRDEYIVSGSDCGRIFFWEKKKGNLLGALVGDTRVVNCVQRRSHDLLLATAGIDHDIKLFSPVADDIVMRPLEPTRCATGARYNSSIDKHTEMASEIRALAQENERILESSRAETTMRIPPAMVLRMLMMMRRNQGQDYDSGSASEQEDGSDDGENEGPGVDERALDS